MLAPPWISVPPPGYGGVETVIDALCDALERVGHAVTLFAAPGSTSGEATVRTLLDAPHSDRIGQAVYEADHVARAFGEIDEQRRSGHPFDLVHDHGGFTALAMADRLASPVVHTLHGAFTDTWQFYAAHGHKAHVVGISASQLEQAPPVLQGSRVIPNPIAVADWELNTRTGDYLLWIGRMSPEKGPHRAVDAAKRAGRHVVLAGPVQPGQEEFFRAEVQPRLDGDRVRYVGEVGGAAKRRLFGEAAALLMPIRWAEPFGMVMVEALVSGTPVIAFREGAAQEIVLPGANGWLVNDEQEMADAVARLDEIDPRRCRESAASRYDAPIVARSYVDAYREVCEGTPDRRRRAALG